MNCFNEIYKLGILEQQECIHGTGTDSDPEIEIIYWSHDLKILFIEYRQVMVSYVSAIKTLIQRSVLLPWKCDKWHMLELKNE